MRLHQLMVDLAGLKSQLLAQPRERVNGNWPEEMRLQSDLMSGQRVECKIVLVSLQGQHMRIAQPLAQFGSADRAR